jgi:hypothetical protein
MDSNAAADRGGDSKRIRLVDDLSSPDRGIVNAGKAGLQAAVFV